MKLARFACIFLGCLLFVQIVRAQEESELPTQDKIVNEAFPGLFEPVKADPYYWTADLNADTQEDLIVWVKSVQRVPNAWQKLPIHNPPYELANRGEILENPMFQPQYVIREGEQYLLIFHGGARGWKDMSLLAAYILQDVAEQAPELTTFGPEYALIPALKIRYEGKPGLIYWEGSRYEAALKD